MADLDNDGDPDLIFSVTINNTPILWIDDDDDLTENDFEGDTDNDCLLIDVNRDGKYGDRGDVAIDWIDTDGGFDSKVVIDFFAAFRQSLVKDVPQQPESKKKVMKK